VGHLWSIQPRPSSFPQKSDTVENSTFSAKSEDGNLFDFVCRKPFSTIAILLGSRCETPAFQNTHDLQTVDESCDRPGAGKHRQASAGVARIG